MPLGFGKILRTDGLSTEPDLYQALKTALAEFTLRTLLHGGGERKGALERTAPTQHPQPGLPQWAVLCPSSLHAWPCGQATGHGTVSRLGAGSWGCWSVAQLNLNENRNDSSGLGSMGQRVPRPPRNKRSTSGKTPVSLCTSPTPGPRQQFSWC